MDRQTFLARSETFGFDTDSPWGLEALRLLCSVPRLYAPLASAWEQRHPGTMTALERMTDRGFVIRQPGVVLDTRTGDASERSGRPVPRYRTTWRGHELTLAAQEDIRVLEERFPRTASHNTYPLLRLLQALDLTGSHARFGISSAHATTLSGMRNRTVKWWLHRLAADGLVAELPRQLADVREVVPEHWRITRALTRQLTDVLDAFAPPDAEALKVEFRLKRSRFLDDVDPARVGLTGATDFDHDVEAQRILAALFTSKRALASGVFTVEPRIVLTADASEQPQLFGTGTDLVFYQPDAELREAGDGGVVTRSVVEYERFQSRRDAWGHIERFLGYLAQRTLPFEPAILRFVVDTRRRERTYVELIEAFGDYALDHPERIPANAVTLAVSSTARLAEAADPLDNSAWFRVQVPGSGRADTTSAPVLHPPHDSPYNDYFSRGPAPTAHLQGAVPDRA